MKFNLEETVTGADLRSGAVILTFSRDQSSEILTLLGRSEVSVDAFVVDRKRVTAAVFFPEEEKAQCEALIRQGVTAESGYFRLMLKGSRLTEGRGLAALWESVLSDEKIPVRIACADCTGITQYLPVSTRPAVLDLLNRTFGIKAV